MKNIILGICIGASLGASGMVFANMNTVATGLRWDDTQQWLGIGVNTPSQQLDVANSIKAGKTVYSSQEAIGTTTPKADFQVATSTANATTSVIMGKSGQNKGTCLTFFAADGSARYIFIATTTFNISTIKATGCQN